ncbi:MAG: glycosyltransferase [bacterium]
MNIIICASELAASVSAVGSHKDEIAAGELPAVYRQVFERFGKVFVVGSVSDIPALLQSQKAQASACVYLSYCLPDELTQSIPCPVVFVFGWQYSSLPDEPWGGNLNHDWRKPLSASAGAISFSSHGAGVIRDTMGEDFHVATAPLPLWDEFSSLGDDPGPRNPKRRHMIRCRQTPLDSALIDFTQEQGVSLRAVLEADNPEGVVVELHGIVYTAVVDPSDELSNWQDFLSAFCWAFRDRVDVKLVVVIGDAEVLSAYGAILKSLYDLEPVECRVVVICESLPQEQYDQLVSGSSYIVNSAFAEAQCQPLMEFMSAGVPAIAPDHTAMSDYVDKDSALVVASSLEWVPWPHDPRMVRRTFRHRINWASLLGAFEDSYRLAVENPQGYAAMSRSAEGKQANFCSVEEVQKGLLDFFSGDRFLLASDAVVDADAGGLATGFMTGMRHLLKKFLRR